MNLQQCEQALNTQYSMNTAQIDNVSRLTSSSWWANKSTCVTQMGGYTSIKNFLVNRPLYDKQQALLQSWTKEKPVETQLQVVTQAPTSFFSTVGQYMMYGVWWIGSIFLLIILWKLIKKVIFFCYDVLNANRIVYLKVILPRNDAKSDREQEKDIAKDMKEKIGRMAQVFHLSLIHI